MTAPMSVIFRPLVSYQLHEVVHFMNSTPDDWIFWASVFKSRKIIA